MHFIQAEPCRSCHFKRSAPSIKHSAVPAIRSACWTSNQAQPRSPSSKGLAIARTNKRPNQGNQKPRRSTPPVPCVIRHPVRWEFPAGAACMAFLAGVRRISSGARHGRGGHRPGEAQGWDLRGPRELAGHAGALGDRRGVVKAKPLSAGGPGMPLGAAFADVMRRAAPARSHGAQPQC